MRQGEGRVYLAVWLAGWLLLKLRLPVCLHEPANVAVLPGKSFIYLLIGRWIKLVMIS